MVCCVPWTGVCIPLYLAMTARGRRGRGNIPHVQSLPTILPLYLGLQVPNQQSRGTSRQASKIMLGWSNNAMREISRVEQGRRISILGETPPPYHTSTTHTSCGALSSAGVTSPSAARSSQNGAQLPPRKGLATAANKPFRYTDTGFLSADL